MHLCIKRDRSRVSLRLVRLFATASLLMVFNGIAIAERIDFNRDIRPILSQNCFICHGPDSAHQEAGLRLDLREAAISPLDSGATAIVPEQPQNSELIARVVSKDSDLQMPPAESGKQLTPQQIKLLTDWIAQGAEYSGHWAFIAPQRPPVPSVANAAGVRTPIDHFILEKLDRLGLTLEQEADKATLIRRASLDLTGLPPTAQELDQFLADSSPDAYERLLDRLFQSPHYGERMAIRWLDFARYADSNGFQSDGSRDIWAWRDWVIAAFNKNMPFDQFTIEQLAGDMLPDATRDQIIATGFNRNHRLNGEGGRIVEEWFVETVIDRVETTGLTWLGLTLNCCRCHDHKYDPITQREFYQLFSFFNSVEESGVLAPSGKNGENTPPLLTISTPEQDAEILKLEARIAEAKTAQQAVQKKLPELIAAWESDLQRRLETSQETWRALEPTQVKSLEGATLTRLEDGSYLASGNNPAFDVYEIRAPLSEASVSGILIEVFPDPSLPNQSLGRAPNGNFVLTDVEATLEREGVAEPVVVQFVQAAADYEQMGWTAKSVVEQKPTHAADKKPRLGWAVDGNDPEKRLPRRIMFVAQKPLTVAENSTLRVVLRHRSQHGNHNIGRFRLSATSLPPQEVTLDGSQGIAPDIKDILAIAATARTPEQTKALEKAYAAQPSTPIKDAENEVKQAQTKLQDFRDNLSTTMVMKEAKPRDAFILTRGEYDKPADKVTRGLPAALPPMPEGEPMDRLGFARWIAHPSNPLTARVWVNRQWEHFFGTGIVKTTENFGSQADYPSHPELLDWLASEFQQPTSLPAVSGQGPHPWDIKALQKLIMLSATYRQSSRVDPKKLELDPENRLLARGSRFRLSAELIRDQSLAVSGLLKSKIGGPSVRPYMPAGVWDETSKYGNLRNYQHETGDGLYRRTLYTIWKRTAAPPTMLLFDAPNREVCTIKRSRTNTPLQALSLLNEVTFVEAARGLATRMMQEGGSTPRDRIAFGFRTVTARQATPKELDVLTQGLESDLESFAKDPEAAKQLVAVGESPFGKDLNPQELAAFIVSANVLLNLDEVVTRE